MLLSALEINDTGLVLLNATAQPLVSPGVAVIEQRQLLLGDAAMQQLYLKPGSANTRFWQQLNLDPLGIRTRQVRTAADLVYAHLKSIWRPVDTEQEVILVVPGVYSTQQLGLLLGITRECGIPVSGLVDCAVAGSRYSAPGRQLLHLDVHLHRLVLSELAEGELIQRGGCDSITSVGLSPLTNVWCNRIADAFVRNTRFDPMHQAESEQLLHDSLPGWLDSLETHGSALLELKSRGRKYQLTLKREELVQASREMYQPLAQKVLAHAEQSGVLVQLTHRARALPGLIDVLTQTDRCEVIFLEEHAGALGALHHAHQIRAAQDSLRFVTSLPWEPLQVIAEGVAAQRVTKAPITKAPITKTPASRAPLATHLVLDGIAYRPAPVLIFHPDDDPSVVALTQVPDAPGPWICQTDAGLCLSGDSQWLLNGRPVSPDQLLRSGDRLTLLPGSPSLLAICLEPGHG